MALERRSSRLLLRSVLPDDHDEYVRVIAASQSLHAPWTPRPPPGWTPVDSFRTLLERSAGGRDFKGVGVLADGRIGGLFNLNEIVRGAFHSAYAGWSVNAEVAGRGVATEGVGLLLDLAFGEPPDGLGLHRVQANIVPRNAASIRVAEKNGMRREGLALRYLTIDGVWEDHLMFALTAEEWPSEEAASCN